MKMILAQKLSLLYCLVFRHTKPPDSITTIFNDVPRVPYNIFKTKSIWTTFALHWTSPTQARSCKETNFLSPQSFPN